MHAKKLQMFVFLIFYIEITLKYMPLKLKSLTLQSFLVSYAY